MGALARAQTQDRSCGTRQAKARINVVEEASAGVRETEERPMHKNKQGESIERAETREDFYDLMLPFV